MPKTKKEVKRTNLSICNGDFYVNDKICNKENEICEGKLIGILFNLFIYTDYFDDERHRKLPPGYDSGDNFASLFANLKNYKRNGIDMICFGLQGMNPNRSHYRKSPGSAEGSESVSDSLSIFSSAFFPDGSLNKYHIETVGKVIEAADNAGLIVFLTLFTQYGERHFHDEFAIINAAMNIFEWLDDKKYRNLMINFTDQTRYQFKSKILSGSYIFDLIADLKQIYPDIIVSTVLRGETSLRGEVSLQGERDEYKKKQNISLMIENFDFLPIFPPSGANTAAVLEEIYACKTSPQYVRNKLPVIIVRGDNLNEKYNLYGENNMIQALKNGASWCYYDVGDNNNKDGFICLPVNFDLKSSKEKRNFSENVKKIKMLTHI